MISGLLLVAKLVNYLYYVRGQITRHLVNLDKNGIAYVMDLGMLLNVKVTINYVLNNNIFFICIYRWRKHKCNLKKRNRLLNGLNKCTCFSPDGNLYTKLEMDKNKKYKPK